MMMSPESYVDQYKDAPYTDLIEVRDELVAELRGLEGYLLNPPEVIEAQICPSPDARYELSLDYLAALNNLMRERVRELIGDDDWDDEDFDCEDDE